jgi:hypothetical protein
MNDPGECDVVIMQIEDGNLRIIQRYERQRKLNVDMQANHDQQPKRCLVQSKHLPGCKSELTLFNCELADLNKYRSEKQL